MDEFIFSARRFSTQSFICSQKSRQHTCDTQVGRRIPGLQRIAKDGVPVPSRQNLPLLVCRRKDRGVQRFVQKLLLARSDAFFPGVQGRGARVLGTLDGKRRRKCVTSM